MSWTLRKRYMFLRRMQPLNFVRRLLGTWCQSPRTKTGRLTSDKHPVRPRTL